MSSVAQSFLLSEEQAEAVEKMMQKSGLQKAQLFRRALGLLAAEMNIDWPEDPRPGRPWEKESDDK